MQCCSATTEPDLEQALLVERHHAESFLHERVVSGVEVRRDRDVVWVVHDGETWRNAGVMVRFSERSVERRLDTLLERYRKHGRGMALWISPAATPTTLPDLLKARGLRCRKHFPAMVRPLRRRLAGAVPRGIDIRLVTDMTEFEHAPHPAIGPLSTLLRRRAYDRLRTLVANSDGRTLSLVASVNGKPVGATEIFIGNEAAGIHGLYVPDEYRGKGIGSALLERGCIEASRHGAPAMVLLASTEGQRLYEQRGFTEVGRFAYWYRSFHAGR